MPTQVKILSLLSTGTLTVFIVLSQTPAQATAEATFRGSDLAAYLERAREANPDLAAYQERYQSALQRVPQAHSLPDPMLQVTQFVESVQTRTGPQDEVVMLSQKIPWFGKLKQKKSAASAEAEALFFAFQARQLALMREVATAFYEYGYIGKAISLTQANLQLLNDLEPIVEERVHGGGDLNALLRLKVETGKVGDQVDSLQEKRRAQSARLAALLALPGDELLPWPDWEKPISQNVADTPSLSAALESNNPELAMLDRKVSSAAARRELARLEGYPDVTLGLNYIHLGDPLNPTVPDAGNDPWGVTVAVNIPLWRGRIDAQRKEALSNQRAAEADLTDRKNRLNGDLSVTLSQLRDAQRRLDLYGSNLIDLAQQAVDISRTSYESGRTGILEVIDSERSLLELDLLYWRAAADTWRARVTLQTLINQPISAADATSF